MDSKEKMAESHFLSEGSKRIFKIFVLAVILTFYFFFLVWTIFSPFISSSISGDFIRFSVLLLFGLALIFVVFVYSGYAVAECPNCGKRLFFYKKVGGMRCFRCGKFLKVDFGRRVIVDSIAGE